MSIPTLNKTWVFNANIGLGHVYAKTVMRNLKDALTGLPSCPWTCWGSCDGTAYGNGDSVDRWTDDSDLVWSSSGNRSWFVFNIPGFNEKTAMCINLASGSHSYAAFTFSWSAGFGAANGGSNGTTSAAPTATDGIGISYDSKWGCRDSSYSNDMSVHAMQASDGSSHRVFIIRDGLCTGMWTIETPVNAVSDWTDPIIASVMGTDSTSIYITSFDRLGSVTYGYVRSRYDGGSRSGALTAESLYSVGPVSFQGYPDDVSGEWPLSEVGYYITASSRRGRKCSLSDIWWGGQNTGFYYPDDGSKQLIQMGDLVVPWDGSFIKTV